MGYGLKITSQHLIHFKSYYPTHFLHIFLKKAKKSKKKINF